MAKGSTGILRTVAKHGKRRPKNTDVRKREHLTPDEVEVLATAAKKRGRYGHRDALAIRMAARHGFRVSELCELRWDQVDLRAGLIHVSRKKNGVPSTHPLSGDEVRALRQLKSFNEFPRARNHCPASFILSLAGIIFLTIKATFSFLCLSSRHLRLPRSGQPRACL